MTTVDAPARAGKTLPWLVIAAASLCICTLGLDPAGSRRARVQRTALVRASEVEPRGPSAPPPSSAVLSAVLSEQRGAVRRTPIASPIAAPESPRGAATGPQAGSAGAGAPDDSHQRSRPERNADPEEIAAAWSEQASDPTWSATVSEYLGTNLTELQTRGALLDVSCKQTLCRAMMRFDDPTAASGFSDAAADPDVPTWVRVLPSDGPLEVEVFFARN